MGAFLLSLIALMISKHRYCLDVNGNVVKGDDIRGVELIAAEGTYVEEHIAKRFGFVDGVIPIKEMTAEAKEQDLTPESKETPKKVK